jgi:hypothetical protein
MWISSSTQHAWVAEVRLFLVENVTPELRAETAEHGLEYQGGELSGVPSQDRGEGLVRAELADGVRRPWIDATHQHLLMSEFEYARRARTRPHGDLHRADDHAARHGAEQDGIPAGNRSRRNLGDHVAD